MTETLEVTLGGEATLRCLHCHICLPSEVEDVRQEGSRTDYISGGCRRAVEWRKTELKIKPLRQQLILEKGSQESARECQRE